MQKGVKMTIQTVIYNKGSMILCTDLRQTVEEFKSYVGVKKIFELKKSEPVGIMFNGLMDFEGVPIETLIGEFKENFMEFEDIKTTKKEFLKFLKNHTPHTPIDEYLPEILVPFKDRLLDLIEENGFKNAINSKTFKEIPEFLKKYHNFNAEFHDLIPEYLNKKTYNLKIWQIFSYELDFEGTEVILAGFDKRNHYGSLSVFNIYCNNNGQIISKDIETIENCQEAFIRVYAMNEEAYTFITGISDDFENHIINYVDDTNEEIINNMEWYLTDKNFENRKEILHTLKNELDSRFIDLTSSINNFKFNSIEYTSSCCEYLPRQLLCDFGDSLIKLTALKQKISLDLETVSSESDVALITKANNLKWIRYTEEIV